MKKGNAIEQVNQRGFTLIELMVVVTIVGILAAIVFPSFMQYVVKANRTAAQAQMMDIANRQQQFLLANRSYASKMELESSGYSFPVDVSARYSYTISLGNGAVPAYIITFTPIGSQTDDGILTINNEGVKTPAAKW